ncbi:MAG: hypothetical protein P8176_08210 [Gammaproteobacteria bacterium]
MSTKKELPSSISKKRQKTLPPGYEWQAVSAWRISQLQPSSCPPPRTHSYRSPILTHRGEDLHHNLRDHIQVPTEQPPSRLQSNTDDTPNSINHIQNTRSKMRLLEDLEERFFLTFRGLPSEQQVALRDRLQEADLALFHFQQQTLAKRQSTLREQAEQRQLSHDANAQWERLAQRLKAIIARAQDKHSQEKKQDTGSDDSPQYALSFQSWSALVEALILAISSTAKSGLNATHYLPPLSAPPGNVRLRRQMAARIMQSEAKKQSKQLKRMQWLLRQDKKHKHAQFGAQPTEHKSEADATFSDYPPSEHSSSEHSPSDYSPSEHPFHP